MKTFKNAKLNEIMQRRQKRIEAANEGSRPRKVVKKKPKK